MVIPLRTGLAVLFFATLALASSQAQLHVAVPPRTANPLLPGDPPHEGANAAYGGAAALAVGGLGLFARFRRR